MNAYLTSSALVSTTLLTPFDRMANERQIHIRPETNADILAIEAVTAVAFKHAEHTDQNEQFIVRGLPVANHLSISLVAEDQVTYTIIGYAAVSPVTKSDGS